MFPIGKLPHEFLRDLLQRYSEEDARIRLGPGVGLDCAVIEFGERLLVAKSDPITFTSENIGWYAVHINANDIATTGARPAWFLATLLLPEDQATDTLVEQVFSQLHDACEDVGAQLVGGHTEITTGIDRVFLSGTMLGEVEPARLVTPRGAQVGDRLLLTKGVPIEATSILARDFPNSFSEVSEDVLRRARAFLFKPGISVVEEALAAAEAGGVTAMHDPTEGGLAMGLWELSEAAGVRLVVEQGAIPIPDEARILCEIMQVNPLEAIASGALLLAVQQNDVKRVRKAIAKKNIPVTEIGSVTQGQGVLLQKGDETTIELQPPARDALARLFEREGS